jgi:hypothetical protein
MHLTLQENVTICCSSPERFLKLDRHGVLEARPIKGTAARVLHDPQQDAAAAQQLAASEKDRAENLMIVDLLRNDLGCICQLCSVHVPALMEVCDRPSRVASFPAKTRRILGALWLIGCLIAVKQCLVQHQKCCRYAFLIVRGKRRGCTP